MSFGTATGILCALVTVLKADGKFDKNVLFILVIVAFSIIVLLYYYAVAVINMSDHRFRKLKYFFTPLLQFLRPSTRYHDNSFTDISSATLRLQTFRLQI